MVQIHLGAHMQDFINLVDINGSRIGSIDKLEAHVKGLLHEAFSIFIFNAKGELLLQQRAQEKYHSGGLWTNTVCSHPGVGENLNQATQRRLVEEMGLTTPVNEVFAFVYRSELENGLIEHEYDHVFVGYYDQAPQPNPAEVMNYKWITLAYLYTDIKNNPDNYTVWFKKILANHELYQKLEQKFKKVF